MQEVCRRTGATEIIRSSATGRNATYRVSGILSMKQLLAHPMVHAFSLRAGPRGELIVQVTFLPANLASDTAKKMRAAQNRWANRCKSLAAALKLIQKEELNGGAAWAPDVSTLKHVKVLTRDHAVVLLHHAKAVKVQGLWEKDDNITSMEVLMQFDDE